MHVTNRTPEATADPIPVVCSLDTAGLVERRAEFQTLFGTGRVSCHRDEPAQLRLVLAASDEEERAVRDLFRRESICCPFFAFAFRRDGETLTVNMGVPVGSEFVLDEFEVLVAGAAEPASE